MGRRFLIATALAVTHVSGCGSPTAPDPRVLPQVGPPTTLMMNPCEYVETFTRCPVVASWGYPLYASRRDVTSEASWSTSAPNIAGIVGPGTMRSVAPGAVDIMVAFGGQELTVPFRVIGDGPPWRVYPGEYHIQVTDANGVRLEGVLVEIISGANAGMSAISDRSGTAILLGEHVCGPITVRATKAGYHEWLGSATRCGKGGNGNWGSEGVGPVRMIPLVMTSLIAIK